MVRREATTILSREECRPYFIWDDDISIAQLKSLLAEGSERERVYYTALILREAKFDDVWRFVNPRGVYRRRWETFPRLGRRRGFWEYIIKTWERHGYLS